MKFRIPNVGGFGQALDFSRGSLSLNSPFSVRAAIHAFQTCLCILWQLPRQRNIRGGR